MKLYLSKPINTNLTLIPNLPEDKVKLLLLTPLGTAAPASTIALAIADSVGAVGAETLLTVGITTGTGGTHAVIRIVAITTASGTAGIGTGPVTWPTVCIYWFLLYETAFKANKH